MKANELRIGNFVELLSPKEIQLPTGIYKKVGAIRFFEVELYDIEKPFAQQEVPTPIETRFLQGIPLTEEWLLKFGYTHVPAPAWDPSKEYSNRKSIVYQLDGEWLYETGVVNNHEYNNKSEGVVVKYVHSLQNIFHALTGDELEITSVLPRK